MEALNVFCNPGGFHRLPLSPLLPGSPVSSASSRPEALGVLQSSGSYRGFVVAFAVSSSSSSSSFHSNPNIIRSGRSSPYQRRASGYGDEDEDDEDDDDEDEDDDEDDETDSEDDDDDEFSDRKASLGGHRSDRMHFSSHKRNHSGGNSVHEKLFRRELEERQLKINGNDTKDTKDLGEKERNTKSSKITFAKLKDELDFDVRWFPLIEYLTAFGFKESHFISIYERHMPCLQINVASAKERLEYLMSVGVKQKDMRRILLRQPQILEYTVENNLKVHVAFLQTIGIPDSRIGHVITSAPSLLSYNVDQSLKPTIRYLVEEVGIREGDVSKVVQLSPQILVQRIETSWSLRLNYLSKELGAPRESIVKMVRKHPQLLHYSIEDGIQPRIDFLRSIGMCNSEIVKVLTSLTQVLSLSLEANLKPKYLYLVNELRNEVKSLTKYPTYLSLSLDQRIRPRHRFLVSLKKAPKGPFPLSSFVPTDESFCQQWAGTSVDKYLAFRQSLLLDDFAKKYERRR